MSKGIFLRKTHRFFMQSLHLMGFFTVMALVFFLSFRVFGKMLSGLLAQAIDAASFLAAEALREAGAPAALSSLILDGILPGVGSILSFVPVIGVLFFFLTLLQESGFLSRIAALLDAPMQRIGLSGQAIIPMIMGFGCNVPAIIAAGDMLKDRERRTVVMMIPFLSCSARLPIYGLFISAFFADHGTVILCAVYAIGIIAALLTAAVIRKSASAFSHMPHQRCRSEHCTSANGPDHRDPLPAGNRLRSVFKAVFRAVFQNCFAFVKKAFTVILAASVIVWFLQYFDPSLHPVESPDGSLLTYLGKAAAPLFAPLGFGDWRAAAALISGIFAKEAVISTLAVIAGAAPDTSATPVILYATPDMATTASAMASSAPVLSSMLPALFTPLSAFSFMTFCLLYTPCIATFVAVRQCIGMKRSIQLAVLQMAAAWLVSLLVFQVGIA